MAKSPFLNEVPLDELREFLEADPRGVVIWLRVKPGSSREKLFLMNLEECCLSVSAAAVDFAANARVCEIIAQLFLVKKSSVEILSGHKSKKKKVLLRGATLAQLFG